VPLYIRQLWYFCKKNRLDLLPALRNAVAACCTHAQRLGSPLTQDELVVAVLERLVHSWGVSALVQINQKIVEYNEMQKVKHEQSAVAQPVVCIDLTKDDNEQTVSTNTSRNSLKTSTLSPPANSSMTVSLNNLVEVATNIAPTATLARVMVPQSMTLKLNFLTPFARVISPAAKSSNNLPFSTAPYYGLPYTTSAQTNFGTLDPQEMIFE
jgi:hypothetical protein